MDYCFLKGFLVVLLIQQSTSEDLSPSIQSSTTVTLQDDQASSLHQEPELMAPAAEVVPVVAPPSLEEVQQAVQEASEQVEVRGAEEVLKGLLERVVEAALGQQVEGGGGGGEARAADEMASVQGAVEEDEEKGEGETIDTEAEVLEQGGAVEMEMEMEGGDIEEEQMSVKVDDALLEDVAEGEGKGVAQVGEVVETAAAAAGAVVDEEETTAGVATADIEAEEVEEATDDESLLDTKVGQEVVEEETVAVSEEAAAGGYLAVQEAEVEQVELSENQGAAETDTTQELEEILAVGGGEPEQAIAVDSSPSLVVEEHVENLGDVWGTEEEAQKGQETQVDEIEGEVIVPPPFVGNYEMETTQTVVKLVKQVVEEDIEGPKGSEDQQGHLMLEAAEEVEAAEGAEQGEAEGGEIHVESAIREESVALVNEGGDQGAGEEEQIALETSHGSEKEDQEVLMISGPGDVADASIEQIPENQVPTPGPSLVEVEIGENTLGDEQNSNHIITPTDLLPHDPVVPQPTLDNLVKDVLAQPPEAEAEEPGEANELVEDKAGTTDTSELGLDAWKIGAISAAVFIVLETIVMIYILKCRKKNSSLALQRACEEGCVEPEAATGGDCSDDTLPAGNGDAQQIAAFDPSGVASTLAQNKEQHQEDHGLVMSDLPPSSTEESASSRPGPADSSQDFRTSIL